MRRLIALAITLSAAGVIAGLTFGSSAQGSSTSQFDVIFDDARGLVGGQLVKIAGAQAGTIENVVVTPNFKARVQATVQSKFMPFHQNATCTIRPEGLIAENYIDCDPGTADSPPLKASGGQLPTVPVTHTAEPVSLLDLFNIFNLPTRERLQAIINELGIGTAGRGDDFNDILLRANPTLLLARQAISILSSQRRQLAAIVDSTNTIAAQAASHTGDLQSFLRRAAALSSLTAAHRDPLSQAIARLPGLLAAAQPALAQLNTVAVDGTPLVQQLHAAVPSLSKVSSDLGPFVAAAKPGLAKLTGALKVAIPAIRDTTPMVSALRSYVSRSLPGTKLFAHLAENLQRHGFVENFLSVTYYIAASLARFDTTSHLLSILLVGPKNGLCGNYATKPVSGCSAHYGAQTTYAPQSPKRRSAKHTTHSNRTSTRSSGGRASTSSTGGQRSRSPVQSAAQAVAQAVAPPPAASATVHQTTQTLQSLLGYLVK